MATLFLLRHSPYGSTLAREALDMALASAAFGEEVVLLFSGDGVLQLLAGQQGELRQQKNLEKSLSVLPLYEIEKVYADQFSLAARGVDPQQLAVPAKIIDSRRVSELLRTADAIMSF